MPPAHHQQLHHRHHRGIKGVDYYYLSDSEMDNTEYENEEEFWASFCCCHVEKIHGKPFKTALHKIMHLDNSYLNHGYRRMPTNSYLNCFLSMFSLHNETLNVWTHFLPFLYWVYLLFFEIPHLKEPVVSGVFALCAIFVFLGSSLFHIFKCNSIYDYHFFLTIDFYGIIVLLLGCNIFFPYIEFVCYPQERKLVLASIILFTGVFIPLIPYLVKHRKTWLRTLLFTIYAFFQYGLVYL